MDYIYFYVERKVDGTWQQQFKNTEPNGKFWYEHRHYWLFSLLAGVRGPFVPIAEPRGLPEDLSPSLKEEWEKYKERVHTPSHYTLAELLKAQDTKETFTGFVDVKNYKIFKATGKPEAWSMQPFKGDVVLTNERLERIMKLMNLWNEGPPVTEITFEGTNKDIGKHFWEETIPAMQALDPNPENVRCVFWFDK
jgi:hypothetical protein